MYLTICSVDIFYGKSFSLSISHWCQNKINASVGIIFSLMMPTVNLYILYRLSTSLICVLRGFTSKLRVWIVSYVMVTVIVSIILATGPMAHTMETSDLGIPFAKINYHSL